MTENRTPGFALRVRLTRLPESDEFDEFDLSHYKVGQTYVVPSRLASLLILSGYATLVESRPAQAEAADSGHPRTRRK